MAAIATVQLRCGDLFDGPSDLIVLPCSTLGTVTGMVHARVAQYHLLYPNSHLTLGDVEIQLFTGAEHLAQFVAYAASVGQFGTTETAIEKIGERVGVYSAENAAVRFVAAPLLGGGAGGLRPDKAVKALRDGFAKTAAPEATLVISVLQREVYRALLAALPGQITAAPTKRVFISYTKTSGDHQKWVEALGCFLRQNGIEARLDVWHLHLGMDLQQFMGREIQLANHVLIISNEEYARRADLRQAGVGWEIMLIQGEVARLPPESTKYLVVVHDADVNRSMPFFLTTKYAIHWPGPIEDPSKQQLLLRELLQPVQEPALGERPVFI